MPWASWRRLPLRLPGLLLALVTLLLVVTLFEPEVGAIVPPVDQRPVILYARDPIQDARLLPDDPLPAEADSTVRVAAALGEIESASFVIRAGKTLQKVTLTVSDLAHEGGEARIDAHAVAVRLVKVWYQAGNAFALHKEDALLAPELLLYDDALIKVDRKRGQQWVRIGKGGRQRYHPIFSQWNPPIPRKATIRDAASLVPFEMARDTNQQMWLTFRVPETAEPGSYTGTIRVDAVGIEGAEIDIALTVYPFALEPARIETSLYYVGWLSSPKKSSPRGWFEKEGVGYLADMKNLIDHGVLNPTIKHYASDPPHSSLDEELLLRRQAGMKPGPAYIDGLNIGEPILRDELLALERHVTHWVEWFGKRGYGPVYFYGKDEAKNDEFASQIPGWTLTRSLGGRVMVACYTGSAEVVGHTLDMPILAYEPDPAEAARYHAHGQRVYNYANPQVGLESPLLYRTNYGFTIWKSGYDGSMTYAYQAGMGDIWNDFDGEQVYRDLAFTYPSNGGPIDTIQWEGFREASDDLRYLATLQARIEALEDRDLALRTSQWLAGLEVGGSPQAIRDQIVARILELDAR